MDRLTRLEVRVNSVEKAQAVNHTEFVQIKEGLTEIKSTLTWVTRLIIGALVLALLTFMLSGGTVIAPIF